MNRQQKESINILLLIFHNFSAIVVESCNKKQCQNYGICYKDSTGISKCICLPGYFGPYCELYSEPCASMNCNHRGVCTKNETSGSFYCDCDCKCEIKPKNYEIFLLL